MKSQIAKLDAHTDHLVGCLFGMKEKYAFLEPLLFDKEEFRGHNTDKSTTHVIWSIEASCVAN
jgi:hypothetical protein